MAGSMSRADLIADLKASLHDSAGLFSAAADADFIRHLDNAAQDFARLRPRIVNGSITLVADQDEYTAPADAVQAFSLQWGRVLKRDLQPWDARWPGALPRLSITGDDGARRLVFSPAPSARQIALIGATCAFRYCAGHSIDALPALTTILSADRALLLLRAAAEAMKELASRNVSKASKVGSGLFSSPKNGTPAALHEQLMSDFERLAKR